MERLKDYTLEFIDDFTTGRIEENKWVSYYLPQWSSRIASATNYKFVDNNLILKIDQDQKPWCPEFNGEVKVSSLQTGLFSGPVGSPYGQHQIRPNLLVREAQESTKLYTPKYGYFEIRARALAAKNTVCAFWLIGFEDKPYKSAEICIMEVKGENVETNRAVNGYGLRAFADDSLQDEFFEERFEFDANQYNIYAAEWMPDKIDFYLNHKKVRTIHQSPNSEMQFMLIIYEVPIKETLGPTELSYPKEFEIDYVKAFRPASGY